MAKASKRQPAIPLMIGDYFKDPRLGQASLLSRGAWFELLLYMWECDRRGEIETSIRGLNRLLGAGSIDEVLFFLNELNDLEFGDLFATDEKKELVFPLTLENCNGKVTIRNRRMYADYKDRQNTRLRVKKYRETKMKQKKKQKCNANVTPSLSVSSSVSSKKKNIKKKKKFIPPDIKDVIQYFLENNYTKESAIHAFKYYNEAEPPWTDSRGQKVRGWKQKMRGVWFKDENKTKTEIHIPEKDTPTPDYLKEIIGNIGEG